MKQHANVDRTLLQYFKLQRIAADNALYSTQNVSAHKLGGLFCHGKI